MLKEYFTSPVFIYFLFVLHVLVFLLVFLLLL